MANARGPRLVLDSVSAPAESPISILEVTWPNLLTTPIRSVPYEVT